jgi:chromosome segregation protein
VRLTQIKLAGFKSFVDPTSIHIPGQLVGIVGPNGCGKSNVIDAVRWVLGESRASALRGDSMQDVIFNGSANRVALARASVELIFDNSLGRAAGQWSQYAEISARRVLQRDGDSTYYINGTHVRRRDITDMFLGTGLGPRAYGIIEQGMISRVIEARPDELRVFLEEAAGVSRYKERRRETEHRLADTRENLARVNDIRVELAAQIEKLEAQAAIATRYREHQSDLQLKQHLLWFLRRRDAAAERERQAQEVARATNEMESDAAALRAVEARIESARAEHYGAGDALNAAQADLYAANAEVARHESELRHVEETRQRLESQHTERRAQLASWREQRAQLTQSLHRWVAGLGEAKQRSADAAAERAAQQAQLAPAEQAQRAAEERLNQARSALHQAEARLQLEQTNLAHLERGLQGLEQRRERLQAELDGLALPDPRALAESERRIAEGEAALPQAQAQADSAQRECARAEERETAARESLGEAQREHAAAEARLATLRQIQTAAEENVPLREWLERHGLAALPRLWQKLRIDHGWETAVEAVLRERLHAPGLADRAQLAQLVADRPPVKASVFWPGEGAPAPALPGLAPLASKVRALDPAAAGALAAWLAGAYAVEGVPDERARRELPAGAVAVNRDGDQFTRHTASLHAPDPADAGLLEREAEIDVLQARCAELEARLAAAHADAEAHERAAQAQRSRLEGLRGAIGARTAALHEARIEHLKLAQADERHRERSAQIRDAQKELEIEADGARRALATAGNALERARAEIGAARARLAGAESEHAAAAAALAERRRAAQQAERDAQDALFGERECGAKIAELDRSVRLIDEQIARADAEAAAMTRELATDPVPEVRAALDAAVQARIGRERALAGARDATEAAAGVLRELEQQRLQVEARLAPLRERLGELRLKEQAAAINQEQFAAQLRDAGADEALLGMAAEQAPRPSVLQGEITRISQAIADLGAVNMAALEELASGRERKGFLDAQAGDLEEAVGTMEDAIRRIDRETRELLRETFETVNRHFGSLFPVLFGGGEAKLVMTGEEILDAGVQVMAQPPGKRNSTIHLLSGGEKALTAIALVFALFQLNPAPFCLLDEVDAPLDDANTLRFCDLVRRMSPQTQFLFISHNKITMEMAGQLIGVTMPESGVSRVVAVDIEEALRIREELAA